MNAITLAAFMTRATSAKSLVLYYMLTDAAEKHIAKNAKSLSGWTANLSAKTAAQLRSQGIL